MRLHVSGAKPATIGYAIGIFAIGLVYRATFITQGFNATDEGWLQSMGSRIAEGQVAYRDFYFGSPPLSIYEQAALIRAFGEGYGILASRWVFSVEVGLASVLAFVILLRYVAPGLAFLLCLPTCFFTVILYYFTNYSYDGELFALLSIAFLVHAIRGRQWLAVIGGLAGSLAFMAKPTFLGLLGIVILAALANAVAGRRVSSYIVGRLSTAVYVAGFAAGCLLMYLYFAAAGAGGDFINKAFLLPRQTYPVSATFVIWQDMPQWMLQVPNIAGYIAVLLLLFLVLRAESIPDLARLAAAGAVIAVLAVRAVPEAVNGLPTARQDALLLVSIALLWLLNLGAIVLAALAPRSLRERIFPPELPVMALGLQYIGQFNAAGVRFSYYGTFLSVPVALLLLHTLGRLSTPLWRRGVFSIGVSTWAAVLVGVVVALTGIVDTHGVVNRDGPRSQLNSSFRTPHLGGISTLPQNSETVDGVVAAVTSRTHPGDAIFVMPDFPVLYFLSGRRNPTRIGWYESPQVSQAQAEEAVADMKRDPPKVVVLQTYDGADFLHTGPKLDYMSMPQLRPIYLYILSKYALVEEVNDIQIYTPAAG